MFNKPEEWDNLDTLCQPTCHSLTHSRTHTHSVEFQIPGIEGPTPTYHKGDNTETPGHQELRNTPERMPT